MNCLDRTHQRSDRQNIIGKWAVLFGLFVVVVFKSSVALAAGTINVTVTTPNIDRMNDKCSLVEAMIAVNNGASYKDCTVMGTPPYTAFTVNLPSGPITSNVEIAPNKILTINGNGITSSIINFGANTASGCGVVAKINNLTLQNLTLQQNSGLFVAGVCGLADPTMASPGITLEGVRIRSFQNRGVFLEAGSLAGTNIHIQNNRTPGNGGGIAILENAQIGTLTNLSLIGNVADGAGGGLFKIGGGNGNLNNCTISGNSSPLGGGVYVEADVPYLTLRYCTVASNSAWYHGGGIYVATASGGTTTEIRNSVVVSNTLSINNSGGGANFYGSGMSNAARSFNSLWGGPFDHYGSINMSGGPNLTVVAATVTTEFTALQNLGPFFLPMYPLKAARPAVNFAECTFQTTIDERGVSRPQGPGCDSGAYER